MARAQESYHGNNGGLGGGRGRDLIMLGSVAALKA